MSGAPVTHRRVLRQLAIALAVGVLTTLALAWPVPLLLLQRGVIEHTRPSPDHPWTSPAGVSCGVGVSHVLLSDWVLIRPVRPEQSRLPLRQPATLPRWAALPERRDPALVNIDTAATGWPWRAMASESWLFTGGPGGTPYREELRHNLVLATRPDGRRTIMPLRPIWPGLLGDVAVFAGAWWLLLFGVGAARRALRRGRGRCPACGYDLRGQTATGCPECGRGREELKT